MATGFAVAVKLVDLASGPLATINRSIVTLEKSAKKVAREGGLFQARDALRRIKDQAEEVGEGLAKVFSPLGALTAAGSIGGLALLAERFARVGSEINRTSSTLGLSTADLQKWRGAADLAGVGAEAMTNSIAGAAHSIYLMRNGLNPDMFRVVQRWGLDANKGATDAEKGANLILQVAEKIRTDPSLRNNAQAQRTLLGQLGIDERMLWLMQQGKEKIQEFAEASRRHSYLTQEQIDRSQELQFAYNGLTQSVGGFTNAVAAEMAKWLTPTLKGFSDWIDKLKETPGAMKAVEVGVGSLAAIIGGSLLVKLAKAVGLFTQLGGAWAAIEGLTSHGFGQFIPGRLPRHGSEESFRQHANPALQHDWVQQQIDRLWDYIGFPHAGRRTGAPTGAPGALGAPPGAGQGPRQRRPDQYGGIPGVSPAAFNVFSNSIAGIERARYDQMGGAGGRYAGRYQLGPAEIAETAARLGEPVPTQAQFLHDPAMQERYFKNYTLDHNYYLLGHSARYQAMSPAERLGALAYAHNQGAAGAARYLDTGIPGRDAFGTSGTAYSDAVARNLAAAGLTGGAAMPTAAAPLTGGASGTFSLDPSNSRHEVFIDIRGAAPGMRSGLTKAEGPAEVSVRT